MEYILLLYKGEYTMATATKKQKSYAHDISKLLNIPIPADESLASLGHFIAANCDEYHAVKKQKNQRNTKEIYTVQEVDARIRLQNVKQRVSEKPLTSPETIVNFMQQQMKTFSSKAVYVVNLDTKCQVINFCKVSIGTINASLTSGREIFKTAILSNAASIILFHNHVSGDVTPSRDDERLTETMLQCGILLGIPLTDHIIVSLNSYYSFRENNNLYNTTYA